MNDTPPNAAVPGFAVSRAEGSVPVYMGGSNDDQLLGAVEPVTVHGERHWRFVTPNGYRSPFNHRNQDDATDALVSQHCNGTDPGTVQARLEPVDGAVGVAGHDPMYEVYQCPPGCPRHPPVVACGKDRETWPCGSVQAVCAELDDFAGVMRLQAPIDGEVWRDAADLLVARRRALATAGGAVQ